MLGTNNDVEVGRTFKCDGMIYYYKNGWLSNKWTKIYAKLYSDSTLEWFQSKDSDKPIGSILLNSVIPYFCIGSRIKNVPTKKPKMKSTWDKNLLMAIATDIQANSVHWFYFYKKENFRKWIYEITQTLPRIILPQKCLTEKVDEYLNHDYELHENDSTNSSETNDSIQNVNIRKQKSFNSFFNEIFENFGIGEFFFPMTVDSSDYENEIDSEIDDEKIL
uniref:PH domain-containing protein n=1 Tax=Panagrolaimus sp. PS1159 TaxID=55785 RepID=A0AC35GPX5_9BILA